MRKTMMSVFKTQSTRGGGRARIIQKCKIPGSERHVQRLDVMKFNVEDSEKGF